MPSRRPRPITVARLAAIPLHVPIALYRFVARNPFGTKPWLNRVTGREHRLRTAFGIPLYDMGASTVNRTITNAQS
jgi:hypothetical protein